jgi:hypothetical protein
MSSASEQKESKLSFGQQLSCISEWISFIRQEGLNSNLEKCEVLGYIWAAV